jgi:UDP-N-acetylmuramate dehydrogenase
MLHKNGLLLKNFELKKISSFKTGGKAKYYFIPDSIESLKNLLKNYSKDKIYIVGNFTNILASDKGFDGVIISLKGFGNYLLKEKNTIISGAAVSLKNLIDFSINNNLGGLENLYGIPGSVGGAVFMNAGAFNKEIGENVEYVKFLTYKGEEGILTKKEIRFGYRTAKPLDEYIIIEVALKLHFENSEKILKRALEILKRRDRKQPLEFPSAGSVFKRPGENIYAGELIEKSGCKGLRVGDAMVSEKHSNFIINLGNATSKEIFTLIKIVQDKVYEKFKIKLEPEIKFLGEF